jgi:hypothetical protein
MRRMPADDSSRVSERETAPKRLGAMIPTRHIVIGNEPMDVQDPAPPVEVVAGCPICGAVYDEAARIGRARVAINTECPKCGTPSEPDPKDRGCNPPGTT